jgi:hypothetical protein
LLQGIGSVPVEALQPDGWGAGGSAPQFSRKSAQGLIAIFGSKSALLIADDSRPETIRNNIANLMQRARSTPPAKAFDASAAAVVFASCD